MEPDGRDSTTRPDGRQREPERVVAWASGLVDPSTASHPDPATRKVHRKPDGPGELDVPVFPVSVNRPASWRRAAWLAVGASSAVLVALVFAAGRLAEPDRIDAFPGLPTGGLLTAQQPGPQGQPEPGVSTVADGTPPSGAAGSSATAGGTGGGGLAASEAGEGPGGATMTATRTSTGDNEPPRSTSVPTVSVLPSTGSPPVGADELIDGAVQFYSLLPEDIDGAWQMVGPSVRAGGYEGFRRQWSDVTDVRLQEVVVDADESTVLATVEVDATDGDKQVRQYRMVFRGGGRSLTIEELDLVTERGHKPQG